MAGHCSLPCPACGGSMTVRTSKSVSRCFRTLYAVCGAAACGYAVVGSITWEYGLNESRMRDPMEVLPMSPEILRRRAYQEAHQDGAQKTQGNDYRARLQLGADSFIEQHHAEHLDDLQLAKRTCEHLITRYGASPGLADKYATLALNNRRRRRRSSDHSQANDN